MASNFKSSYYKLSRSNHNIGDWRAQLTDNTDPFIPHFKFLIDRSKPSGLFADEEYVDSALAYLKRIGELERYALLKHWITLFESFVKYFDFLWLNVEGLDIIQNSPPQNTFGGDNDKITFQIREPIDMFFQGLLTTYRHIWFDDARRVEVLPSNLRMFDCMVVVFSSGYFDSFFYGEGSNDPKVNLFDNNSIAENSIDHYRKLTYPTMDKLDDDRFGVASLAKFNHQLYVMEDCTINNEESGKTFASSISNEQGTDFIKNTLAINFRFAKYSGRFNNTIGNVNFVTLLAYSAAHNYADNTWMNPSDVTGLSTFSSRVNLLDKWEKEKQAWSDIKKNPMAKINNYFQGKAKNIIEGLGDKLLNSITPIGNMLDKVGIDNAIKMIKNTADLGIQKYEDMFINENIAKINNLLLFNYGNNVFDSYKNLFPDNKSGVGLIPPSTKAEFTPKTYYNPDGTPIMNNNIKYENNKYPDTDVKGATYGTDNVFTRPGP